MARMIKARYGVYTRYNNGGKRRVWFATYEAQEAAYKREKALIGKKPEDVTYVKKIQRS